LLRRKRQDVRAACGEALFLFPTQEFSIT